MYSDLLHSMANSMREFPASSDFASYASAVLNVDTQCNPLTYSSAKSGPHHMHWEQAEYEELVRLYSTSKTLFAIQPAQLPADRINDVTYYSQQVKEKIKDGIKIYQIRGTAGCDRIDYPGEVSARTAELSVVKLHLNATVSENATYATFFLPSPSSHAAM